MMPRTLAGNPVPCLSLSVDQTLTPLSSANMEVLKKDELPIRTYVEIETPNGVKEFYRTRQPQASHDEGISSIQLEHAICEVGDYMVRAEIEQEMTVRNAMVTLFNHYRGSKWQLGSFSASETVLLECDYDNILEMMLSVLEQQPKYMLTFDFTTSPRWTVSVAAKSNTVTAEGRMARNLDSVQVRNDDKDLCTRVFVRGLPTSGSETVGHMDADTISTYGVVERVTGSGDLTEAQAIKVATAYLAAHKHPQRSIEISGEDLSAITGESLDAFVCGKKFRLALPKDNLVIEDYITRVSFKDVMQSNDVYLIIGEDLDPALRFMQQQQSASKAGGRGSRRQNKTNKDLYHQITESEEYYQILYRNTKDELQAHIDVQANRIGLVVEGTGANARIKPAQIVAAINNGASSIKISADHITLDGDAVATSLYAKDVFFNSLSANNVEVLTDLNCLCDIRTPDAVKCGTLDCDGGGYINGMDLDNFIANASVSGNTLTLTKSGGGTVTFSKATSLSGQWSGRSFTVTASPQGNTITGIVYNDIIPKPSSAVEKDGKYVSRVCQVKADRDGDEGAVLMEHSVKIDASSVFDDGYTAGHDVVAFMGTASGTPYSDQITNITSNGSYYIRKIARSNDSAGYDTYVGTSKLISVSVPAPTPDASFSRYTNPGGTYRGNMEIEEGQTQSVVVYVGSNKYYWRVGWP